jgi:hypothetical protein
MAYQRDADGPYVDKGGFRAKYIAYCFVYAAIAFAIFIGAKILFTKEDALDQFQASLKSYFYNRRYNFSLEASEELLTLTLWDSGVTGTAKKAHAGEADGLQAWEEERAFVLSYSDYILGLLPAYDFPNMSVVVRLVNENNKDRDLLVYKDGALVYDIVTGGD